MSADDPGVPDPDGFPDEDHTTRRSDFGRDLTQMATITLIVVVGVIIGQPLIVVLALGLLVVFLVSVVAVSLLRG